LSVAGKNLEHGLRKQGLLRFVRELDGNDEEQYDHYLKDASMYARGAVSAGHERLNTVTGRLK
jgi:hypothetical protein